MNRARSRVTWTARVSPMWGLVVSFAVAAILGARDEAFAAPAERSSVKVLVPEGGNLQLLAFWVALGAGYFADQGIDVALVVPPSPALAQGAFTNGQAPVALLPAPVYERLIEERFPFLLEANLLSSDPIDLVVPRAIAEARGLTRPNLPLVDRLRAMEGMRIGVGPHPRPRLAALFASAGLEVDAVEKVVVVPGKQQNAALAAGEVDALYTHTPFLETALLDQGAVIVVDQSGGEVPALTGRLIHALAVTRAFAERQPELVTGFVRGVARAERLIHDDARAATEAILRALPERDRRHVETLVAIYAPAVPLTPRVSVQAIEKEAAFFPDPTARPSFAGITLESFVASDATGVPREGLVSAGALGALIAFGLTVALLVALADARDSSRKRGDDTFV